MVEAAQAIMKTMGLLVLLESCIVMVVFFVWVVKIEFSWFFGIDIFKKLKEVSLKMKVWFVKKLTKTSKEIDKLNNKERVILNEKI